MAEYAVERVSADQINISGALTFANIMRIKQDVESSLANLSGAVSIDFAGVTKVDSSSLSLWLCILRLAEALGLQLKPQNVPEEMSSIAGLVGLGQYLDC